MENKNRGGRPKKYQLEDLKRILYGYMQEKNPSKITVADLVKHSGIPIQAWRFNEEIKKEITNLNKKIENISLVIPIEGVNELLNIPSAEDLVNTNYKNKNKLIKVVSDLLELYQYNFNKALKVTELENENQNLKNQLKRLKNDIDFYKEEMKKMAIQSTSALDRSENKIKENVIDIKKYSETNTTFKDLFED